MAGIGRFGNVLPDERPQVGRRRAIEGMARLGGQALGEGWHPGLGVSGEEGLVGGGRAPSGEASEAGAPAARRARRSRSSHSVATWSRGSLVPSGRPRPQERMKRSTSMERGFTNKSGCTPSASAAHTPS